MNEAAMQERIRQQLPRAEARADAASRGRERPQREGDDDARRDGLQQVDDDVGDDQRSGDRWHGFQMGP